MPHDGSESSEAYRSADALGVGMYLTVTTFRRKRRRGFCPAKRGVRIVHTGVSDLMLNLWGSPPYVRLLTRIHGAASSG
jgi:hypothetical protein